MKFDLLYVLGILIARLLSGYLDAEMNGSMLAVMDMLCL